MVEPRRERPDPFVRSGDPFWGNTPPWVVVSLVLGFCLTFLFVGAMIAWSFAK